MKDLILRVLAQGRLIVEGQEWVAEEGVNPDYRVIKMRHLGERPSDDPGPWINIKAVKVS